MTQFQQPFQLRPPKSKTEAFVEGLGDQRTLLPLIMTSEKRKKDAELNELKLALEIKKIQSELGQFNRAGERLPYPSTPGELPGMLPTSESEAAGLLGKVPKPLPTESEADKIERLGTIEYEKLGKDKEQADKSFTQTDKLRQQFINMTKGFREVQSAYKRIAAAAKEPSAAGDIAIIFGFMKMQDPSSVVREGEQATAQNAAGVPDRIRAQYNRALNGERLSDATRSDFLKQARTQYKVAEEFYKNDVSEFSRIATKSGLDPTLAIVEALSIQDGEIGDRVKVSNGTETYFIDKADLANAEKDGFKVIR